MKKIYTRRYLKKDNTVSVYNFAQEIKKLDPEVKELKQKLRPFINKMSKDKLKEFLEAITHNQPQAPEKAE